MKKQLAVLMILLPIISSYAQPLINSLSGPVQQGSSLIINGTNFGLHADYNASENYLNTRWKTFDDSVLTSGGWRVFANLNYQWAMVPNGRLSTGYYGKRFYIDDERGALEFVQQGTTGSWFISFWFMIPPNTQSGKFFRHWFGNTVYSIYTGCDNTMIRAGSNCGTTGAPWQTIWGSPDTFAVNQWHRVDFATRADSNGLNVKTWLDGKLQWDMPNWCTDGGAYSPDGHTIDIGNHFGKPGLLDSINNPGLYRCASHPTWNASYNYDDIYIDYTQARVELGDKPIWDSCHHKEIQIPTAWSTNSVAINFNAGGFNDCDTAYLFVVDASGATNLNGYKVIINPIACSGSGVANDHNKIDNFNVYPNPSNGNFKISFTQITSENISIEIVNMLGENIYNEQLNNFSGLYEKEISMSNHAKGIYLLQLRSKENVTSKKIVSR